MPDWPASLGKRWGRPRHPHTSAANAHAACGPGSPELSKSYMDMASKLFTFTFTFTCMQTLAEALRDSPCCGDQVRTEASAAPPHHVVHVAVISPVQVYLQITCKCVKRPCTRTGGASAHAWSDGTSSSLVPWPCPPSLWQNATVDVFLHSLHRTSTSLQNHRLFTIPTNQHAVFTMHQQQWI